MAANLVPALSRTSRRRRGIDRINQLTEPAKSAANRRENQPRQAESFQLIIFFPWRNALDDFARTQDVPEVIVQIDERLVRQRTIEADNEALSHPPRRMKDLVELRDFRGSVLRVVFDFEKREVFLRNEADLEQTLGSKAHPAVPNLAALPVQHHDRDNARRAGSH